MYHGDKYLKNGKQTLQHHCLGKGTKITGRFNVETLKVKSNVDIDHYAKLIVIGKKYAPVIFYAMRLMYSVYNAPDDEYLVNTETFQYDLKCSSLDLFIVYISASNTRHFKYHRVYARWR